MEKFCRLLYTVVFLHSLFTHCRRPKQRLRCCGRQTAARMMLANEPLASPACSDGGSRLIACQIEFGLRFKHEQL